MLVRVLGVVALVGIVISALVWMLRRAARARELASLPPPQIHLQASARPDWVEPKDVERATITMLTLGFSDAGSFTIPEMPHLAMQGFAKPSEGMIAALCEHPEGGLWVEITTMFEDGTSVTYTTDRRGDPLEQRPGHPKTAYPEVDGRTLYHRMLNQRPGHPFRAVSAAEFPRVYERNYADYMEWRASTGRPPASELSLAAARR